VRALTPKAAGRTIGNEAREGAHLARKVGHVATALACALCERGLAPAVLSGEKEPNDALPVELRTRVYRPCASTKGASCADAT